MSSSKGDIARHSKAFLRAWLIQVTWTLESELPLQAFCQAYQLSKGKLLKKNELWSVSLNLIQRQLESLAQVVSKTFRPKPQYPVQWCNIMQHDAAILVLRCCLFKSTTHIRNWFSSAVHWYLHIIPWKWHKYKNKYFFATSRYVPIISRCSAMLWSRRNPRHPSRWSQTVPSLATSTWKNYRVESLSVCLFAHPVSTQSRVDIHDTSNQQPWFSAPSVPDFQRFSATSCFRWWRLSVGVHHRQILTSCASLV